MGSSRSVKEPAANISLQRTGTRVPAAELGSLGCCEFKDSIQNSYALKNAPSCRSRYALQTLDAGAS